MNRLIDLLPAIVCTSLFMALVICSSDKKHTYLVKRLDNGHLQRYEFFEKHDIGDTVKIYDETPVADGPVFIPVKAVIQDTIL